MQNKIKKAFSLAEVLMVMAIIGVVATIAVPTMNNSASDGANMAKAKKVYAELESATKQAFQKYGEPPAWSTDQTAARIVEFLNVTKTCASTDSKKCWAMSSSNVSNTFILKDGSSIYIDRKTTASSPVLAIVIEFDVDGPNKGDNAYGKDVFKCSVPFNQSLRYTLVPFYNGSASLTDAMTSGTSPDSGNYLHWIMQNDNMDYNSCTVTWETKTTCN